MESSHLVGGLSLREILDISKVADCKRSFTLRSAVVNNNIINIAKDPENLDDPSEPNESNADIEKGLGAEIVSFVILQTPVMSVATNSSTQVSHLPFTLI